MKIFWGLTEEKLGEIMKKHRIEHNYTQKKVADYLGIDRTTYTKYETVRKPEIDVIMKLASLYGLSVDEFLGDLSAKNPDKITPFAAASSMNIDSTEITLKEDEKRLIILYRESIRKKEILDKAKEIWADDQKIKSK